MYIVSFCNTYNLNFKILNPGVYQFNKIKCIMPTYMLDMGRKRRCEEIRKVQTGIYDKITLSQDRDIINKVVNTITRDITREDLYTFLSINGI